MNMHARCKIVFGLPLLGRKVAVRLNHAVKHSAEAEELSQCIGEYPNLVVRQITFDLNVRGCDGDIRNLGA